MVRLTRLSLAIVIGSAMISRGAVAQRGASSSLTHTVSVTVPPRVKVQVASLARTSASAVDARSLAPSTTGLSLNVSSTQAWVLSIGSNPSSDLNSKVRWSLESGKGFAKLTSSAVEIASGTRDADARAATVFFRNALDTASSNQRDQGGPPIVLTISAP
ncbi:MAG TPA: hypothetical protein VGO33_11270 [Gemmatimonadaceae bacterium]|jgi:hypothetical protein|nr:hypothetical protein [Gemmatimonadaceae bacterium]